MECVERGLLDEPWLTFGSGDALLRAIELIGAARGHRRAARRGQPPRGADDRPRQHRVRAAGEGARDSRLRAARAADDGARVCGRRARRRPQSQRRLRSGLLGQGRSPARDARRGAPRHRDRRQGRADGLADPLQVPARRVRRLLRARPPTCCAPSPAGTSRPTNSARPRGASSRPKRQFNLLAGWTPAEDTLPERFLDTPLPDDPAASLTPRAARRSSSPNTTASAAGSSRRLKPPLYAPGY